MQAAFDRVRRLVEGSRLEAWPLAKLIELGREARTRWQELRRSRIDVDFAGDAVRIIDPEFRLPDDVEESIQAALRWINGRVAVRFLKWATSSKTSHRQNPFEPLLEIVEHGGSLHVENGMLEIYDAEGAKCMLRLWL
jgi:hypothetical protein